MPAGRPTTYKPEYCQALIEHMGEGYSFESFAGKIGVARSTIYEWVDNNPEFSDAVQHGRAAQLKANEKLMLDIARGKIRNASASAAMFLMKNYHKWTERHEMKIEDLTEKDTEDLKKEAAALMGIKIED